MQSRIAIPLPTSTDFAYNRANWPAYAEAVAAHGAEPVEVPLDLDDQAKSRLARACHAILLPGSPADVDPASYGQARDASTAPPDHNREQTDRFLLEHACHERKAILGVCFGAQMLNVYRGGTLVQDLTILPVNHACSRAVFTAHEVAVAPQSMFARLVDAREATELEGFLRLPVNSSHHQAIALAAENLRVVARCPHDAVIEAVEGAPAAPPHFVLGVQWHPERTASTSATSRSIFERLVREAESWLSASGASR